MFCKSSTVYSMVHVRHHCHNFLLCMVVVTEIVRKPVFFSLVIFCCFFKFCFKLYFTTFEQLKNQMSKPIHVNSPFTYSFRIIHRKTKCINQWQFYCKIATDYKQKMIVLMEQQKGIVIYLADGVHVK